MSCRDLWHIQVITWESHLQALIQRTRTKRYVWSALWKKNIDNYWMRPSMMWRIMQIKENVMTASEICIILHIVLKPNWIMLKFLTSLTPLRLSLQNFGLFLSTVLGYKQMFFLCRYWNSSLVDNIHHWSSIMFCVFTCISSFHCNDEIFWKNNGIKWCMYHVCMNLFAKSKWSTIEQKIICLC